MKSSKASSQPPWWLRSSFAMSCARADQALIQQARGRTPLPFHNRANNHWHWWWEFTLDHFLIPTAHHCLLLPETNWECKCNPFCNDHLWKCHQWPSLVERQIAAGMSPGLLLTNPLCYIRSCSLALFVSLLCHWKMWLPRCCKSNASRGGRMLTSPAGCVENRSSASVTNDWRALTVRLSAAPWTRISKLIPIKKI